MRFFAAALLLAATARDVAVIKSARPNFATISSDGALIAVATDDALRVYRTADGSVVREWSAAAKPSSFAFFPRGDRLALGYPDGRLSVVKIADGAETQSTKASAQIDGIIVADDGKRLAFATTLTAGGRPYLWTLGSAAPVPLPGPEFGVVEGAAFSPDGKLIAVCADDTTITIADTADAHVVKRIDSLEMAAFAVAFSRDGKRLYAGGAARELIVFDTATWREIAKFPAEAHLITQLDVSPDGKRLAAGERPPEGGDAPGTFVVWDVSAAAPRELLRQRNSLGATGRFAASGDFVYATSSDDGLHFVRSH